MNPFAAFIIAQAPATAPAAGQQPLWVTLAPLLPIVLIFYLLMIRPQQRREKQKREMLSTLKKGDRVQTIGGVLGTVVEAREDEVVLKVDETSNTKIRFSRSAIYKVVSEEKAEAK